MQFLQVNNILYLKCINGLIKLLTREKRLINMLICLVLETVWKEVIPQYSFVTVEFETGDFVNIFTNCCIHLVGLQILLIFIRRN